LKTLDERLSHFRFLRTALQSRFPDFKGGSENAAACAIASQRTEKVGAGVIKFAETVRSEAAAAAAGPDRAELLL
jgi:hypothetical protein